MPKYTLITFIFLLSAGLYVHANEGRLDAKWQKEEISLIPGNVINLIYYINNPTDSLFTLMPELVLPSGIRLAIPLRSIDVQPALRKMEMITLSIPRDFPAGSVPVTLNLRNRNNDNILSRITLTLHVGTYDRMTLDLAEIQPFVMAGEQIQASYLLKNHGNIPRKFLLRTYRCNVDGSPFVELGPGESRVIRITAQTDKLARKTHGQSFSLQAYLNDDIQVTDFHEIKVYPKVEMKEDIYLRYPVTLSARYLSRGQDGEFRNGYQLEAMGDGFLDEDRKHKLEFMARGPNNRDLSFLGLYDEYYISYKNRNSETFIGDKSYSLTPLTEYTRYGSGVEQTFVTDKGSRLGGFYMKPRFYPGISREIAGYGSLMLGKENYLGVNYLSKTMGLTGEEAVLSSITAGLVPFADTRLELEYSRGAYREKTDDAYRILLNSRFRHFSFSGSLINAGEFFPGYYTNSLFYYGNLYVRLSKALSLNLTAREDFSEAATDTLLATAPYSKIWQASANFRISPTSDIRAFYMNYQRKDRMPVKQFDYRTESMNIWFSQNFSKINYQLGTEMGKTENRMLQSENGNSQNSYRLSANLSYRPSYKFNIQAFAYYTNINSYISTGQKDLIFGGSAYGQITRNLRTNFQIQNTYGIEEYYRNRNLFQLALDYNFLQRHTLSLNSFYTLFQRQTSKADFSASITYSLKLGVPLKKYKELGSVRGRLVRNNGEPITGTVVYLGGQSALTREDGGFLFNNLKPGEYALLVDRKQLDMNDILDQNLPVLVDVRHAEETYVPLTVVKSSRVRGKIIVAAQGNGTGSRDGNMPALGNIVLELGNETGNTRVLSNDNGTFEFSAIRPGSWTLTVHRNNIDPRYVPKQEKFDLELREGDLQEIEVVLQPRARNIIFSSTPVVVNARTQENQQPSGATFTEPVVTNADNAIWFGVQIMANTIRPEVKPGLGYNLHKVHELYVDGFYKYISGNFMSLRETRVYSELVKQYFPDAFVVAFEGNNPVPILEALLKQKQNR
jgi:hypothetical protein